MKNPKYPLYIISKGRADTMITSRSLSRMKVPHYITIEPQDEEAYENALDSFGIREWVTLIVAPFSNHGDGPGRARNFCWDHSIELGAKRHWVMDDNINDFYRLNRNKRYRMDTGVCFTVMEDFVDRYTNVMVAGPNYRFFCPASVKFPAFTFNTRIYSCNLIQNDCPHRWRGRYNEDTILTLDVLKEGYCTVQFNAFLQDKAATQTVKGGNTAEFYHKEVGFDEESGEAIQSEELVETKEKYNIEGTRAKSQMLVDLFPQDAKLVMKYGRWHHHVNYDPYRSNRLIYRDDFVIPKGNNEYGMRLVKKDRDTLASISY